MGDDLDRAIWLHGNEWASRDSARQASADKALKSVITSMYPGLDLPPSREEIVVMLSACVEWEDVLMVRQAIRAGYAIPVSDPRIYRVEDCVPHTASAVPASPAPPNAARLPGCTK